jgi:hypothetical protein
MTREGAPGVPSPVHLGRTPDGIRGGGMVRQDPSGLGRGGREAP